MEDLKAGSPFVSKFLGGVVAQGLLSATNFLIKIWLARETAKGDFGLFVVSFSTIMVFEQIHNALVNTPLIVLYREKEGPDRDDFISNMATGQYFLVLPLVALFALAGLLFSLATGDLSRTLWVYPLVFVIPVYWMREFPRVLNFLQFRIKKILLMDLVVLFCIGSGLSLLSLYDALSGVRAVMVLGGSYLFSGIAGHLLTRFRYRLDFERVKRTFRETWQYSRWSLIGIVASSLQMSGYVYIVSLIQGLSITADMSAARTFLMPYVLFIASSQRIFLVKAAQLRTHGNEKSYLRFILLFGLLFLGIWSVYVPLLFLFQDRLILLVYTEKYSNINRYFIYWAFLSLVTAFRFVMSYSLQAFKDFKNLALYGCISAGTTVTLVVVLMYLIGPAGALLGLIGGELVLLFLSGPRLLSVLKVRAVQGMAVDFVQESST